MFVVDTNVLVYATDVSVLEHERVVTHPRVLRHPCSGVAQRDASDSLIRRRAASRRGMNRASARAQARTTAP